MKMLLKRKFLNLILSRYLIVVVLSVPLNLKAQENTNVLIDKIIARVDNYIVLKSELESVYQNYIIGGNSPSQEAKCQILSRLVSDKLMVAKADIDSIVVTDEEISANADRRIQVILQNSGNSVEELERIYGKTMEDIKFDLSDRIREQMLSSKMVAKVTSDILVTPSEVRRFFKNIPSDSLPFYSSDVEIAQIVRLVEVSKTQKTKTKQALIELRERILKGESFAELAKKHSQDPSVQQNGGEMGYVGRGAMVSAYEAIAFKLRKGEISMPFESDFGFHIMQLIERRGNEYNSRHILILAKPSTVDVERTKVFLDSLRTQILRDSISFVQAAKKYSVDQSTKGQGGFFFTQDGGFKIPIKEIDPDIYFIIDAMKVGDISEPVSHKTPEGKEAVRVIYFKSKLPPHRASLKDDWRRIRIAATAEKKDKTLDKWFDKVKRDVFIEIDPYYKSCNIMK